MVSNRYSAPPTLVELLADPLVDGELKRAWDESNPNAPPVPLGKKGSKKREQGGWIVWHRSTGMLSIVRTAAGTRDQMENVLDTKPKSDEERSVVAWFHTHPNTLEEGYNPNPSDYDVMFTRLEARVPGILETHAGRKVIPV